MGRWATANVPPLTLNPKPETQQASILAGFEFPPEAVTSPRLYKIFAWRKRQRLSDLEPSTALHILNPKPTAERRKRARKKLQAFRNHQTSRPKVRPNHTRKPKPPKPRSSGATMRHRHAGVFQWASRSLLDRCLMWSYYRGLNHYQYYFGGFLLWL